MENEYDLLNNYNYHESLYTTPLMNSLGRTTLRISHIDEQNDSKESVIKTECIQKDTNTIVITCTNLNELDEANMLKALSQMKAKLIAFMQPNNTIITLKCDMSEDVKDNLIKAHKKLKMYGKKKSPIIPCFDEYGRRLDDKINLDEKGVDLYIHPFEKDRPFLSLTASLFHYNFAYKFLTT